MAKVIGTINVQNITLHLYFDEQNEFGYITPEKQLEKIKPEQVKIFQEKELITWISPEIEKAAMEQVKKALNEENYLNLNETLKQININAIPTTKKKKINKKIYYYAVMALLIGIIFFNIYSFVKPKDTAVETPTNQIQEYIEPVKISTEWVTISENPVTDSFIKYCLLSSYGEETSYGMSGKTNTIRNETNEKSLIEILNKISPQNSIIFDNKTVKENTVLNGTNKISFIEFETTTINKNLVGNENNIPAKNWVYFNQDMGAPLLNATDNDPINAEDEEAINQKLKDITTIFKKEFSKNAITIYNNQEVNQRTVIYKNDNLYGYFEFEGTELIQCRISIPK